MYGFHQQGNEILRQAGRLGGTDATVMELLLAPKRTISFGIPRMMDGGGCRILRMPREPAAIHIDVSGDDILGMNH